VMKQADLRIHRTVARLPFADHMNRFITGDRVPCSPRRSENADLREADV
jgi:hypothetical protein